MPSRRLNPASTRVTSAITLSHTATIQNSLLLISARKHAANASPIVRTRKSAQGFLGAGAPMSMSEKTCLKNAQKSAMPASNKSANLVFIDRYTFNVFKETTIFSPQVKNFVADSKSLLTHP